MSSPRMGSAEWGLLLLLSGLWGASFFFFKILVAAWPPMTVVMGRLILASLALNLIARSRKDWSPPPREVWPGLLALGALTAAIPFSLIAYGETKITSGLASILNATTPIFTLLIAHVLTKDDRLSWRRGLGVALAFLGVVVVVGPSAFTSVGRAALPGELAALAAALTYGFAGVYGRRFRGLKPMQIAVGQVTGGALLITPMALIFEHPWTLPLAAMTVWGALVGLALLSTALAFLIYFRILSTAGATNVSLVTCISPIVAIALGFLLLGERLDPRNFAGLGLIALGLIAIDGRAFAALRRLGMGVRA